MTLTRRGALRIGGLMLAGLPFWSRAAAQETAEVQMRGNADGSEVWFEPIGLFIRPGQTVRWVNRDPGNSHTSTAYHPASDGHPARIPPGAQPWNSDYLLPEELFEVTFTAGGVYDYFCIPHEHAGMVGRIVVAAEGEAPAPPAPGSPIPGIAEDRFPPVQDILRNGRVFRS